MGVGGWGGEQSKLTWLEVKKNLFNSELKKPLHKL